MGKIEGKFEFLGKFHVAYNNKRAVFKLNTLLKSHMVQPKDAVDSTKENAVAYSIPYVACL